MVDPPSKPAPKPHKSNQQNQSTNKRISKKIPKKPKGKANVTVVLHKRWLLSIVAFVVLLSSAGLMTTFIWISIQFIFNPEQLVGLNQVLPQWAKIPLSNEESSQTLQQIQASLSLQGQIVGEILPLESDTTKSFLLPVFHRSANCQSDCQYLVELRIYQRSIDLPEKYYHLVTQLPVSGPEESSVFATLDRTTDDNQGSGNTLPLSQIGRFEDGTPSSGIWFYLRGERTSGKNAIAYGHIVYYNPEHTYLQLMLPWTSTTGQLPQWLPATNGSAKELIVDQTVGLEPQLRVYQVKPVKFIPCPIQLEAISLTPAASQDSAYQNALLIARSGLWTPAFEWLQFIKKQRKGRIPEAAQAQIDLIRLHSQLTKNQADISWASPSQQVLADLVDGRWGKALQVFAASPQNAQEIATLLKADEGRLWNRVEATLRVNPNRPEVQAWGALILATQHGQERANSWLKEQPKTTNDSLTYIQNFLEKLNMGMLSTPS
ncbi:MAG: hypothetical protein PUP93_22380 [Rhizonema sp. NSF051]|nr:hypothetical protein [Rhizonema sp. NSF051]